MRLFWALALPEPVTDRLLWLQARLRAACPRGVRWVRREQLHVTCRFLGEVSDPQPVVAATGALPRPGAIPLELRGLGSFGGRHPRVVWAGISGPGLDALVKQVAALDAALMPLGFASERQSFTAHVTLARPRRDCGAAVLRALRGAVHEAVFEPVPFVAREMVLLSSSHGQRAGPSVYTCLARMPFD